MKKLLFAMMLLCGVYSAQAIKIIHGPYLQAVSETEATIMWVTDTEALSWVEVAPNDDTHFYYKERPRYYQTYLGKRIFGTLHQVKITGLEPGKSYRYGIVSKEVLKQKGHRVHYGNIVSTNVYRKGAHTFSTLDPKKESIEFFVVNDIHAKQDKLEALFNCYEKSKTDMVIFNGDMVSMVPNEQILFEGFLDAAVKRFASNVPFYFVRGNHETRGMCATKYLSYFPTTTATSYYTVKQGNTLFIMLDGGEDKPDSNIEYYDTADYDSFRKEEAEWLRKVVESDEFKQAKHRIVCIHMPPIGGNKMWYGPRQVRDFFLPILNNKGISVMLCGHTHKYSYNTDVVDFPILVNAHDTALKAKVTNDGITIDVVDMSGAVVKSHSFH